LDDLKAAQERRIEEARCGREERRKEERRRWQQSQSEAYSWPEAFAKGLPRIQEEARDEADFNSTLEIGEQPMPPWFQNWAKEVKRAKEIYSEESLAVEERIAKLRNEMLAKVAGRLAAEFGETQTVEALRTDDYNYSVSW